MIQSDKNRVVKTSARAEVTIAVNAKEILCQN